jgi:putative transposase
MNAYTERGVGTIRREALDHFLLFSEKQVRTIIRKYVEYYNFVVLVRLFYRIAQNNHQRPHQGINGIQERDHDSTTGIIKKKQILGGLHQHYYRSSA